MMFNFTYTEAKIIKSQLEAENSVWSKRLSVFPKGPMGLTPDHIKFSPEYREVKENFDKSWKYMRDFNGWFTKKFKKEIAAERKNLLQKE